MYSRFRIGMLIVLVLGIPGLVILNTPLDFSIGLLVLPLTTAVASALFIVRIVRNDIFQYMRLFFWSFVYVMFGIAPITQIGGSWFWPGQYQLLDIIFAYSLIWGGGFSYEVGYHWGWFRVIKVKKIFVGKRKKYISPGLWFAFIVWVIAFGVLFISRIQLGSFFTFWGEFEQGLNLNSVGSAFFNLFIRYLPLLATLWLIWDIKNIRLSLNSRFIYYFILGLLLTIMMLTSNFRISSRWWFGTFVVSLILSIWGDKRYLPMMLGVGFPVAFILVFPFLNIFRFRESYQNIQTFIASGNWLVQNLRNGDFDSLQQVMNIVKYVHFEGYTYGYQVLGLFTFWIPREIWLGKPLASGVIAASFLGYSFTNVSSPLWAEGYIDFGIFGTLLFLAIWGYVCNKLDESFSYTYREKSVRAWWQIVLWFLVPAQQLVLRGSLFVAGNYILPGIIIMFLWHRFVRAKVTSNYNK